MTGPVKKMQAQVPLQKYESRNILRCAIAIDGRFLGEINLQVKEHQQDNIY